MGPLIILILLFFVMYTVMIRPQQRRAREHQALIAAVQVGEEVMTTAGIFGTVTSIEGDVIGVEIAPGTVMRVARAAIGRRILPDDEPELEESSYDDDSSSFGSNAIEEPVSEAPTIIETPTVSDAPTIIETPDDVATSGDIPGETRPGNGDAPGPRDVS